MKQQVDGEHQANDLALRLSDLWSAERCDWSLRFDAPSYLKDKGVWVLLLEWTDEYAGQHHQDFTTYSWQFYAYANDGEGPVEALRCAVEWCEGLLPWRSDDD